MFLVSTILLVRLLRYLVLAQNHSSLIERHSHRYCQIFYFVTASWDPAALSGNIEDCHGLCTWYIARKLDELANLIDSKAKRHAVNVVVYHRMSWSAELSSHLRRSYSTYPICSPKIDFHILSILEALSNYPLFLPDIKHYDFSSSTNPKSEIQAVYSNALLNDSLFLPVREYSQLIKGISFMASNCRPISPRNRVFLDLQKQIRVDSLGNCFPTDLKTVSPPPTLSRSEWSSLHQETHDSNVHQKQTIINYYFFHLAFENAFEEGYVTEKAFDALSAGTIPIYLGDSKHLKRLLDYPIPNTNLNLKDSVIYLDDFLRPDVSIRHNISSFLDLTTEGSDHDQLVSKVLDYNKLIAELQSIMTNETKFSMFWEWRKHFSTAQFRHHLELLATSWQCRVCKWSLSHRVAQKQSLIGTKKPCFDHSLKQLLL